MLQMKPQRTNSTNKSTNYKFSAILTAGEPFTDLPIYPCMFRSSQLPWLPAWKTSKYVMFPRPQTRLLISYALPRLRVQSPRILLVLIKRINWLANKVSKLKFHWLTQFWVFRSLCCAHKSSFTGSGSRSQRIIVWILLKIRLD